MSDADDFLENTLDDYLLGLAQGIQHAQQALNQLTIAGVAGQSPVAYHLPKLDFELRLRLSVQSSDTQTVAGTAPKTRLLFKPPGPTASENFSGEAISTIRGSFVSVPVSGGRPPPLLLTSMTAQTARDILLSVTVNDALGTPQSNVEVQVNVDRERSTQLSAPKVPKLVLNAGTDVEKGVLLTDATGQAQTVLHIAPTEIVGALVAVTIDALGATANLVVPVLPLQPGGIVNAVDR